MTDISPILKLYDAARPRNHEFYRMLTKHLVKGQYQKKEDYRKKKGSVF